MVSIRRVTLIVIQLPCSSVSWESDAGAVTEKHPRVASSSSHTSLFYFRPVWEKFQTKTLIRFLWGLHRITLGQNPQFISREDVRWPDQSSKKSHNCNCTIRHVHHPITQTYFCVFLSLIHLFLHQTLSRNKEGLVVQLGQAGQNRASKWFAQGYPGKHIRRAWVFLMLG